MKVAAPAGLDLLPNVLVDMIYRYRHEMTLRPSLSRIEEAYSAHKKEVDQFVVESWAEWNVMRNWRAEQPGMFGPGGLWHKIHLTRWFRFKRHVTTHSDRARLVWAQLC